jgi:hypothetical protein
MFYSLILLPVTIVAIFFSIGSLLVFYKNEYFYEKIIYGFGFTVLLINFLYFICNLHLLLILQILLAFFLLSFAGLFLNLKRIKDLIKSLALSLIIIFLFFLLAFVYGEQFYVFRGNIYDHFSYLSTGMIFSDLKYSEVLNLYNSKIWPPGYISNGIPQIHARPSVQLLLGVLFNIPFISVADVGYIFKTITTVLTFFSFISFVNIYLKNNKYSIFIGFLFILSFFYFYNYEIDALSLIVFTPFFILILKNTPFFLFFLKNNNHKDSFIYIFCYAVSFIVYPNGSAAVSFPIFMYLIYDFFKKKINYKYLLHLIGYFLIFLLLVLPFYKSTIMYLVDSEIPVGLTNLVDFWGYYGAFILGKSNPTFDIFIVQNIKTIWATQGFSYTLISSIIKYNLEYNNIFFAFNIFPSIFGFYHFTTSANYVYANYILLIFLIYISYNIFFTITKNLKKIFYVQNALLILLRFFVIYFIIFFIYLVFNSLFWSAIKLFFIFSPLFFLIIAFNFSEKNKFIQPKYLFMILLSFLPFYKYSEYNYGIGKIDSFPSILKKEYKKDINWILKEDAFYKCDNIKYKFDDKFKDIYVSMTFNKYKKNNKNFDHNKVECEVLLVNKNFVIK